MRCRGRVLILLAVLTVVSPSRAAGASKGLAACDDQVRARPDFYGSYLCFYLVALRENAWQEAGRRLETILSKNPENHFARGYLAQIEADQGHDRAEDLFRVAAEGFVSRRDRTAEAYVRISFAYFLMRRERLAEAGAEAAKARAAAEAQRDDPYLVSRAAVAQAAIANLKEEYGRAWTLLKNVEGRLFPDGPLDLRTFWLSSMGKTCWATGRHEEAFGSYRREAELVRQTGNLSQEANALQNMVLLAAALGRDREEIVGLARQALAAAIAGGNQGAEGRAHAFLAEQTEGREALDHAGRSLALGREMKNPAGVLLALRAYSNAVLEFDPAEAFRSIEEAIEMSRRYGNLSETARNVAARSALRWKKGPREAAVADSLEALDAIEASRDLQPDIEMRARRFAQWSHVYETVVGRLLSGHLREPPKPSGEDLALAFWVSERSRARSLLDELDAARATPLIAPESPLASRRAAVLEEIVSAQRRLVDPALPETKRQDLIRSVERLEVEEASLREEMARAHPAFAALRRPAFASLREVQEALLEDEALLAFQVGRGTDSRTFRGGSWVFAITRDRVAIYPLPDRSDLDRAIELFLGLFDRRDGSEAAGAARLYGVLLRAALGDLPSRVQRLVILPDESLHRLAFSVLRPAPEGAPIAARYEITIAPSATLWLRWRKSGSSPTGAGALALADPALPGAGRMGKPVSPLMRQWALGLASRLSPLRYARAEGRSAVQRLGGESRLLVGEEATERFLKTAEIERFGTLHFATHALLDDEHPERSAVLLAPGHQREDGLVQIREIVNLHLAGPLVVLSACRSASGSVWRGEGVMGLARAFFQAGARTVVGSLWPLRDEDAAAFFEAFYRHLSHGTSVAAAHAGAQRERIDAGAPAAAWAGVVALGDGDLVPLPGGRRGFSFSWWYALLLAVVLAAAGTLILRLRRRAA